MTLQRLSDLMNPAALDLIRNAGGETLIRRMGVDVIREVVLDILSGRNLRDLTEALTRRRIVALNLALLEVFVKGRAASPDFIEQLPSLATAILATPRLSKTERWLAQWALGLTTKAMQNVLTDDLSRLEGYRDQYIEGCAEVIARYQREQGGLSGQVVLGQGESVPLDTPFLVYLMNAIGAQTLTLRGSEKSAYGKLFEKLTLGAALSLLDFEYIETPVADKISRVFWLSSRDSNRESDATLLYEAGKGVRFDIGFIGRGNSEISLDKVSRFERELTLGQARWFMGTIILVFRIPVKSRIEPMAQRLGATIIQMSGGYWLRQLAAELERLLGYQHPLAHLPDNQMEAYMRQKLATIALEPFVRSVQDVT
jgi:hypothetical protein